MRRKFLAGNWKMNKLNRDVAEFFQSFKAHVTPSLSVCLKTVDVCFAGPYTLLDRMQATMQGEGVKVAAQNVHWQPCGAFTGEISAGMLAELGVKGTLVGHSERRQFFAETDQTVAQRTAAALEHGLLPIVCIGETKDERLANQTFAVVERQLNAFLAHIKDPEKIIIAYEPVWAIGTGLSATSGQAQEVHEFIRKKVRSSLGEAVSGRLRILYGGSANPKNIKELIAQPDIDGALVGGASLDPKDFAQMVSAAI